MSTKTSECLTTSRAYVKLIKLPMGCLSSRSTISPLDVNEPKSQNSTTQPNLANGKSQNNNQTAINNDPNSYHRQQSNNSSTMSNKRGDRVGGDDDTEPGEGEKQALPNFDEQNRNLTDSDNSRTSNYNDVDMSMNNYENKNMTGDDEMMASRNNESQQEQTATGEEKNSANDEKKNESDLMTTEKDSINKNDENNDTVIKKQSSLDDETNIELLKQYVAVDYEITQLEDKDTLMVYHEKIEQLEQLERELDMISAEAEEVAARSEGNFSQSAAGSSSTNMIMNGSANNNNNTSNSATPPNDSGGTGKVANGESNSMMSGSIKSNKSWLGNNNNESKISIKDKQINNLTTNTSSAQQVNNSKYLKKGVAEAGPNGETGSEVTNINNNNNNNSTLPYSSVEEVFNRKIILEKERDKLKKEVELVIIECDKLQQRYKKRDEILDKLFDGRAGTGLENHLEQQLNWLLEQKHYVDQVFYSWKRAETLTSQTCEQFASALELLKRLPKIQQSEQREELAKLIGNLLIKSRQDMEQAQKYNPNVDAPFFSDNETERFDKIIETISSNSLGADYSQIITVIQFAYKRAVSIRLWLEQILQTTIARDSFELAEEYKWIAIQLRKERINLIKLKLEDEPYRSIAQSVLEEIVRQQTIADRRQQQEINRDSGVESETNDIDIEEEIYRLLELNKNRLEDSMNPTTSANGVANSMTQQQLKVSQNQLSSSSSDLQRHQFMRERIEKRIQGQMRNGVITSGGLQQAEQLSSGLDSANSTIKSTSTTSTRLRVDLDEKSRQNLLKQVDQLHNKHKSKIDRLRGNNKAKANNFIMNRLQEVRQQVPKSDSPKNTDTDMMATALGLN